MIHLLNGNNIKKKIRFFLSIEKYSCSLNSVTTFGMHSRHSVTVTATISSVNQYMHIRYMYLCICNVHVYLEYIYMLGDAWTLSMSLGCFCRHTASFLATHHCCKCNTKHLMALNQSAPRYVWVKSNEKPLITYKTCRKG